MALWEHGIVAKGSTAFVYSALSLLANNLTSLCPSICKMDLVILDRVVGKIACNTTNSDLF